MRGIVLIGYRGCGKSTVGRLVADRLQLPFVDMDERIAQRAGRSIADIFAEDGEQVFRKLESEMIGEFASNNPSVLSVGGGAVLREDNVARLREHGTVVWLKADAGTLWARIARDAASVHQRPPLTRLSGVAEVIQVLAEREPLYQSAAHHVVDAAGDDPAAVAQRILRILGAAS